MKELLGGTSYPEFRRRSTTAYRLGVACVVGGVLSLGLGLAASIDSAMAAPGVSPASVFLSTSGSVQHLLMLAGILGMISLGAVGRGPLAWSAAGIAALGIGGLLVAEVVVRLDWDAGNTIFGIATPVIALGMLALGIETLRAHRWTGWKAFTPLLCGLYVPAILIPSFALAHGPNHAGIGGWGLPWLLLGMALMAGLPDRSQVDGRSTTRVRSGEVRSDGSAHLA